MAGIRFNPNKLVNALSQTETKAMIAIQMYAQEGAKKFENYAKLHRRWVDRTGHARQRLTGYVEKSPTNMRIYISHGVNYGIHLELGHEKRYAILQETVDALSQEILDGYTLLMNKIKV